MVRLCSVASGPVRLSTVTTFPLAVTALLAMVVGSLSMVVNFLSTVTAAGPVAAVSGCTPIISSVRDGFHGCRPVLKDIRLQIVLAMMKNMCPGQDVGQIILVFLHSKRNDYGRNKQYGTAQDTVCFYRYHIRTFAASGSGCRETGFGSTDDR